MALDKAQLKADLTKMMDELDPASSTVSSDWMDDWATALDKYIRSGTPTPASPSFSNTTGSKSLFKFQVAGTLSAVNIANACGAYVGSLLTPVGGSAVVNTALATSSVLALAIVPTTTNDPYSIIVDAIDSWTKSVVWTVTISGGTSTAKLT